MVDPRPADARAGDNFDGRAYALAVASQRLLKALGLWQGLAGDSQPIRQVKASQGQPGEGAAPFFLHFDSAEIEEGPVGYMLEDRFLYRALLAAMRDQVQHLPGLSVTDQQATANGIEATLSDGRRIRTRLLVGGRHLPVIRLLPPRRQPFLSRDGVLALGRPGLMQL